jgi:hypothetical protein
MRFLKVSSALALLVAAAVFVPGTSATPARQADTSFSVQPGQYSGQTSQGYQMAFDVVSNSPDFIDSWSFGFTLTCAKTGRTVGVGMGFGGFNVPIGARHTFSFNFLSLQFYFHWQGKFTSATAANGSAFTRWAAMQDPRHSEVCSSGPVTWNATHASSGPANLDSYDMYFMVTKGANGKVRVQQIK